MCVGSGLTAASGRQGVAARAEDILDLIMNGEKLLRLARRFETAHTFFSPSGRPVRPFGSIVATFMTAMLDSRSKFLQGGPVASKLISDNHPRLTKCLE